MPDWTFDQVAAKRRLQQFFVERRDSLQNFGSTVNQTFEAFVLASVIQWYRERGWKIEVVNPRKRGSAGREFRLKFSTRGAPGNFSHFRVTKGQKSFQIRHQLRVATFWHKDQSGHFANVCLDVAVIRGTANVQQLKTFQAVPNTELITFGEAKHMSAYAELIAGFVGLVHELQPKRLKKVRTKNAEPDGHLSPFLFVSGVLFSTAKGIEFTIKERKYDVDVYSSSKDLTLRVSEGTKTSPRPKRRQD